MKMLLVLLLVFSLVLCWGCTDGHIDSAIDVPSVSVLPSSSPLIDSTFSPANQSIPSYDANDRYENVRFDVDVDVPDGLTRLSVWDRGLLDIQPDDVVEAFSPYCELEYETMLRDDGSFFDKFSTDNGETIVRSWRWRFVFEDEGAELLRLLFHKDRTDLRYNADFFHTDSDLTFFTRDEACDMAMDFLYKLDLAGYVCEPEVYTLPKDQVIDELNKHIVDDPYMGDILESHGGEEAIQEAYFIFVPFHIDGVPVMSDSFTYVTRDVPVMGSGASFIICETGFIYIRIDGYLPGGTRLLEADLISIDAAMRNLDDVYNLVILSEPVAVKDVVLCYVPDETTLTPAYGFLINQNDLSMWVYINALTGEQII